VIHELREYVLVPGKTGEMVTLLAEVGLRVRGNEYGKLEGYWTTEIGPLNRLVHLWSYPSLDERTRLRQALAQNEAWKTQFLAKLVPNLVSQESRVLVPALPFKPPSERGHLYELRRYRVQAGRANEWLGYFRDVMPVREKYSPNVGTWQTEFGPLNEVNHLWAYRDLNHRAQVRAAALGDPEWQAFVKRATPLLTSMESMVLAPTAFSPIG
jgi:hypothetical protein